MMILQRNTEKYKLKYMLSEKGSDFVLSVEKDDDKTKQIRSFLVKTSRNECECMIRKLCSCRVTPVSVEYILQDSGIYYEELVLTDV